MPKPNLFIIGAPKCGTTSLYEYLNQHSEIFMSPHKEPHYFNISSNYRSFTNIKEYESLFDCGREVKWRGEASVWYYYFEESIPAILKYNPDSKFIFMKRPPEEMFFSLHTELLNIGQENITDVRAAWNAERDRQKGQRIPLSNSDSRMLLYSKTCNLDYFEKRIRKQIGSENLFVCGLEELKENPRGLMERICQFLKIPTHEFDIKVHNATTGKRNRSYRVARMVRFFNNLKTKLGIRRSWGILNFIRAKNAHSTRSKIEIDSLLKQEITEFFSKQ